VTGVEDAPVRGAVEDARGRGCFAGGGKPAGAFVAVVVEDAEEWRGVVVAGSEAAEEVWIGDEATPLAADV
jgi:hypothetical protein